jgi:hypothetical protein
MVECLVIGSWFQFDKGFHSVAFFEARGSQIWMRIRDPRLVVL